MYFDQKLQSDYRVDLLFCQWLINFSMFPCSMLVTQMSSVTNHFLQSGNQRLSICPLDSIWWIIKTHCKQCRKPRTPNSGRLTASQTMQHNSLRCRRSDIHFSFQCYWFRQNAYNWYNCQRTLESEIMSVTVETHCVTRDSFVFMLSHETLVHVCFTVSTICSYWRALSCSRTLWCARTLAVTENSNATFH